MLWWRRQVNKQEQVRKYQGICIDLKNQSCTLARTGGHWEKNKHQVKKKLTLQINKRKARVNGRGESGETQENRKMENKDLNTFGSDSNQM